MTGTHPTPAPAASSIVVGLIALAAALILLLGPGSTDIAGAQADPYNPTVSVVVVDNDVCGGEDVVVTASGADAGDSVDFAFAGQTTSVTAGPSGTADTSFSTASVPAGGYTLMVTTGSGASVSTFVTVRSAQSCNPGTPPALSIADPSVCGGESAVATVTGTPGAEVTITFAGQSDTVTISSSGTASTAFPTSGLAPGDYSFDATSNGQTASAPLVILDPSGPECSPTPPPPSGPYLTVNVAHTCVDQPVVVTVTGANPGDGITVTFAGTATDTTAGSDGTAQVSFPTDGISVGTYDVGATTTSGKGDSARVEISDGDDCGDLGGGGGSTDPSPGAVSSTPEPDGLLAFTGANIWRLVTAGAALVLGGGLLVWRVRRTA